MLHLVDACTQTKGLLAKRTANLHSVPLGATVCVVVPRCSGKPFCAATNAPTGSERTTGRENGDVVPEGLDQSIKMHSLS